jgi:uncharacterized membrane protein
LFKNHLTVWKIRKLDEAILKTKQVNMSKKKHITKNKHETTRQKETTAPMPSLGSDMKFLSRYGIIIVCAISLLYIIIYGYICCAKYESFSYYDYDLAIFNQVSWNTLHGNFMYSTIREGVYEKNGIQKRIGLFFKEHATPALLFFLPVYAIFKSPITLLLLQTLFLGAAAIPLYLIARRLLHAGWGIVFVVAYFFYPALGYINLFEFHPTCFVPFFLFAAFYFYMTQKYVPFVVFLALAMFCKEDIAVIVFMFGVYALIDHIKKKEVRAGLKWVIVPSAMGLVWAILIYKFISPMLNAKGYVFGEFFKEMGGSFGGIVKTAITRPFYTLKFIFKVLPPMINKPLYIVQIFLPLLFVSFLSPLTLLIIVPQIFLYLASSKPTPSTIYFQYTAAVIPLVFISAVMGIRWLESKVRWRQYWFVPAGVVLFSGLLSCIIWGTQFHLFSKDWMFISARTTGKYDRIIQSDHRYEIRQHMVELIPDDASVVSMFRFLAKLSSRARVYSLHPIYSGEEDVTGLKYTVPDDIQYVLIDYEDDSFFKNYERQHSYKYMQDFIVGRKYGVEKVIDAFVLLKEGKEDLTPLYEILKEAPTLQKQVNQPVQFNLNGQMFQFIGLIGTDLSLVETDGFRQAKIASYWQCINEAPRTGFEPAPFTINIALVIVNSAKPDAPVPTGIRIYPLCYEIYPTTIWKKDEIIKNINYISLPPDLPGGEYNILLQPVAKDSNLQRLMTPIGTVAGSFVIP